MSTLQFPMYGILYRNIYVCSNGIVSFSEAVTTPNPSRDDNNLRKHSFLAPFFTDLQLRSIGSSEGGVIYYQAYDIIKNNSLQRVKNVIKAQEHILSYETDLTSFVPTFLLVVTWDRVSPYPANNRGSENVTFQLILVTDGLNTFSIYIYFREKMRLQFNDVFIGYAFSVPGVVRRNVNSFTSRAYAIDSNVITNGHRGVLYYRLTPSGFQFNSDQRVCLSWWSENRGNKNSFESMNSIMPPCPCFLDWLWWDSTFGSYYFQDSSTYCAVVRPRWSYSPHGKTCCYNVRTGQYQRSAPTAGGFLQYHMITYSKQYRAIDARMKDYCCHRTNLCHLYYELRPVSRCYNTFPFTFAIFWGDPHIETFDKKKFTFNGWGEYTLVSLDNFQLQSRTSRAEKANGSLSNATLFSAFAAKDSMGSMIHVELNSTKDGLIVYAQSNENSSSFNDYTLDFADMSKEFNVQDEYISLSRDDASRTITVVFSTQISLNITVGVKMLAVSIVLPTEYRGKSRGLLGDFNGNPNNDFTFPNGTVLPSNSSEQDIFNYGQTWAVNSNKSIFRYPPGKSHADFHHEDFMPQFLDEADPDKVTSAKKICGEENQECIFDFVFTENEAVANYTRNIEHQASKGQMKLDNNVPTISGNGTVYARVGSTVNVQVNGSDDGNFTYRLQQNTLNASIHVQTDSTAIISFVLVDSNPVSVSITAEDTFGVQAPSLDVSFWLCTGCSNKGLCDYARAREDNRSTPFFKYAVCNCDPYWEGNNCEVDFNGCASTPCSPPRTCVDNPAPVHEALNRPYNCSCPSGYAFDGFGKCVDLNECNTNSNGCNQTCVNTEGSYYCTCGRSFRVHANKKDCEDIDECNERTDGCDQGCKNAYGGFECTCKNGYIYNITVQKCVQVIESMCVKTDCSRAYGCTKDEQGNEVCFCRSGYRLTANDSCEDINECDQYICSQDCENLAGSFKCKCFPGYALDTDKTSCTPCIFPYYGENCSSLCDCGMGAKRCDPLNGCICESGWAGSSCDQDVNECLQNPFICNNTLKNCINNIGSYACNCITGYKATNDICTDINECDDPTRNTCEQTCINTLSGFTCDCWPGYKKDPKDLTKCIDIDECASGRSECDQECSNSIGRFTCSCYFGYELTQDRKTCVKVEDPCSKYGNLTCDQICFVNLTTESNTCACNRGYILRLDNKTCEDINECTERNGTLNECSNKEGCNNTNGSYICSCEEGFKLENDGRTCSKCDNFHYGPNCTKQCNCSMGVLHCDNKKGCICKTGWYGDVCDLDIDECSNKSVCSGDNNNCVNAPGSYTCMCKDGYEKISNDSCVDVNECRDNNLNQCEQLCVNTNGGYNCSCISGYLSDGNSCLDKNECLLNNDTCPQACQNTNRTYRCVCYNGFEGNGTICVNASGTEVASYNVTFSFNITVNQKFNNTAEYMKYLHDVNETLSIYFGAKMGNSFIFIENITLSAGSLNARCSLIIRKSAAAISLLVRELSNTLDYSYTIRGEIVTVLSLEINGYNVSKNGILCELYLHLIQTCPHDYTCSTDENGPSCRPIHLADDNFTLILGLGVGIPLGVIGILLVIAVTMYCRKVKRKGMPIYNKSSAIKEGFAPFSIPTRLLSHGYIGHGYETYKWEEDSRKGSINYPRKLNTSKRHHLEAFIEESDTYEDNEVIQQSKFSWDFMLEHMEKYEIKRPNKLQTPNPIYATDA